ncbi:MAG: succinylglutamate desuccinylase/aspartoacylase family protein [Verrucomicrobia bacterium]|nr:succinylglutamate desuccinylase/aspartoacylase family protein [Verrucomicrobiota bacterium]
METGAANHSNSRSIEQLIEPLRQIPSLGFEAVGAFQVAGRDYFLPRFVFRDTSSSDPIRIGIFAAIHGDEPAGALAIADFLRELAQDGELGSDYSIHAYPICNPTGFEDGTRFSRNGRDLNREFWKNSSESEVQLLENELRTRRFNGIIQLHADDTSDGLYGFVRGHTLTENILRPALLESGKILPRNVNAQIDGFAARDGIIYDLYEGVLGAPAKIQPEPFEIVFETPGLAPLDLQVQALVVAMRSILTEYRRLISFAQNI